MRKSRGCGLAPVNKLRRLVAPNGPESILPLPRCSHSAPPFISKDDLSPFRLDQVAKGRVV